MVFLLPSAMGMSKGGRLQQVPDALSSGSQRKKDTGIMHPSVMMGAAQLVDAYTSHSYGLLVQSRMMSVSAIYVWLRVKHLHGQCGVLFGGKRSLLEPFHCAHPFNGEKGPFLPRLGETCST